MVVKPYWSEARHLGSTKGQRSKSWCLNTLDSNLNIRRPRERIGKMDKKAHRKPLFLLSLHFVFSLILPHSESDCLVTFRQGTKQYTVTSLKRSTCESARTAIIFCLTWCKSFLWTLLVPCCISNYIARRRQRKRVTIFTHVYHSSSLSICLLFDIPVTIAHLICKNVYCQTFLWFPLDILWTLPDHTLVKLSPSPTTDLVETPLHYCKSQLPPHKRKHVYCCRPSTECLFVVGVFQNPSITGRSPPYHLRQRCKETLVFHFCM